MKTTTETQVRALINGATDKLRADFTKTLIELANADQLRRDNEKLSAQLDPYPLTRLERQTRNNESAYRRGYSQGHAAALDAVLTLIRNAPVHTPNTTLANAVKKLAL